MSGIDLRVEGDPDACHAEAQACRDRATLAREAWLPCETGARVDPAIFEGSAADGFTIQARRHSAAVTDAENALLRAAKALDHHATMLRAHRAAFQGIKDVALAAELTVSGQHIRRPTDGDDKKLQKFQDLVDRAAYQRQRENEDAHELLKALRNAARETDFKGATSTSDSPPPRDFGHVDKPAWVPPTPDQPDRPDGPDGPDVDEILPQPAGPATPAPSTSAPTSPADLVSNNHPSNPPTNPAGVHAEPGLLTSSHHTTSAQLWAQPAVWAATLTRPHLHANEAPWLDEEAQPV